MLKLTNVTKSFNSSFEPVLKSIDLELEAGDFCVLIGSNGSGKSTLISSIAGEYPIDSGTIIIDGNDVTNKDRSHLIATVVQDVNKATIPQMTLLENMVLGITRSKKPTLNFYRNLEHQILSLVKELNIGLENYLNRPLDNLSGGQRQMIATLMAISSKPQILFLDEHTSALDPKSQKKLMEYTASAIKQHKITTLMVTHKLEDAIKYGNRLIMLHQGQVIFTATADEKSTLTVNELLTIFHKYEDLTLCEGGEK